VGLVTYLSDTPPPRDALVLVSAERPDAGRAPIVVANVVDVFPAERATRIELLATCGTSARACGGSTSRSRPAAMLIGCAVLSAGR
jgi:hypothetical protein